ncbi:hypothetical protein TNCV_3146261 [Trichonephila clavipes]|nr:hypothetical protein TNCV_3146261 [Trichonephila clavipes]
MLVPCSLKLSPSRERCCGAIPNSAATLCHTAAPSSNFPMIRPRLKAIQMSFNRLIIHQLLAEAATRCILTAILACTNLFARNTDLTPKTCFILLRHSPQHVYLHICT